MAYLRTCAPVGEDVSLKVLFVDQCGNPKDVDTDTIALYLYDETIESDVVADAIENSDYTGASTTIDPTAIEHISTGFYEYIWSVPTDAGEGTWHDVWVGDINSIETAQSFQITVQVSGNIELQEIGTNTIIVIELSSTITSEAGNTLEEDTQLSFSTVYDPLYASPDLLRLEIGTLISGYPDETLYMVLHWASQTALAWIGSATKRAPNFEIARTKFTLYDAALQILLLPATISSSASGGKTKSLGDLYIKDGTTLSQNIIEVVQDLKGLRDEWARVLNAGGTIVPGQGLAPSFAVKGVYDPNRAGIGRLWAERAEYAYPRDGVNTKEQLWESGRYKFTYRRRS